MIKLISFLFTGCWHRWNVIDQISVYKNNHDENIRASYVIYVLKCNSCGDLKQKKTINA